MNMKKFVLEFLRRGFAACGMGFSDTLSDFATDRCRRDSNRKSGLHWNLFNNRTCFYCRRYERHLSN